MGVIHCRCSGCGEHLEIAAELAGRRVKCPKCSTVVVIDTPQGEVAASVSQCQQVNRFGGPTATTVSQEHAEETGTSADATDDRMPCIATDAEPSARRSGRNRAMAAGRGGLRLVMLVGGVSVALILVLSAASFWFLVPRDFVAKNRPSKMASPPGPDRISHQSSAKPQSFLVLDWPTSKRTESAVYVDGARRPVPSTGEAVFAVTPGKHTVLIKRQGFEPIEKTITFQEGAYHHVEPQWKTVPGEVREDSRKSVPSKGTTPERDGQDAVREAVEKRAAKLKEAAPQAENSGESAVLPNRTEMSDAGSAADPDDAVIAANDGTPEAFLAAHDLRRLSRCFALVGESEVSSKLRETESLGEKAFAAQRKVQQAWQLVNRKKRLLLSCVQRSRELNAQLPNAQNVRQHNQLVAMLNELESRILIMRESKQEEQALERARARASSAREQYAQSLIELREYYNEIQRKYDALQAEPEIAKSIERYNNANLKSHRLGPTIGFARMQSKIAALEQTILTDAIELRKGKSNLWHVIVMFNGEATTEMAIDTGASLVVLPWDTAVDLGLTPDDDEPSMRVTVADGRVVEARRVIADTVRIGKFSYSNVECAVMPDGLAGTIPLLGMSFLQHFDFRIDSGKRQLMMSQLDTSAMED